MEEEDKKLGLEGPLLPEKCEERNTMAVVTMDELCDASDDDDKGSNDENGPLDENTTSSSMHVAGRKRRRCRRNRKAGDHHHSSGKRPYKPYTQMSWEERKQVDERETKRANWRREKQIAAGQAMAPYNTTQFLMEQHEPVGPSGDVESFLNVRDKDSSGAGRSPSSVTGESSAADIDDGMEDMFLKKEFSEAYENFHAERLQMLSKDELIREYVQMETKLERLQREQSDCNNVTAADESYTSVDVQHLKERNSQLVSENERLRRELAILRSSEAALNDNISSSSIESKR